MVAQATCSEDEERWELALANLRGAGMANTSRPALGSCEPFGFTESTPQPSSIGTLTDPLQSSGLHIRHLNIFEYQKNGGTPSNLNRRCQSSFLEMTMVMLAGWDVSR